MSERSDNQVSLSHVDGRLRRAWRRQRRFASARGLCYLAVAVGVLLAVGFLLDWNLNLPPVGRQSLIAAAAVLLVAVGYAGWWRRLRPYDAARIAIQVESLHPQLRSVLVSHVQLRQRLDRPEEGSSGLIRALGREAGERSREVDFGRIVDFRRLRRPTLWCMAAICVVAGWSSLRPELVEAFFRRMLDPHATLRYPTRTILDPVTTDCGVQEGAKLSLVARAGGEVPEQGLLILWPADGPKQRIRLDAGPADKSGSREFVHTIDAVYDGFRYAFYVGDAATDACEVRVFAAPAVRPHLEVRYPEYTGRKTESLDALAADVLESSEIRWQLEADRPLAKAEMIIEGGSPIAMELSSDGLTARHKAVPPRNFTYSLRWTDLDHGFVYSPPARHTIKVLPDRPPRVLLTAPTRDLNATVQKQLDISFNAKDDYGLKSARIVYAVENRDSEAGEEAYQEIPLDAKEGLPLEVKIERYRWDVRQSIPDLAPGDTVRYAIEVRDNRPRMAGVVRSDSRRLKILTVQEYARFLLEERNRLLFRLKQVYDEERQAAGIVERLKEE